jgi:hypothetical protein
MNTSTQANTEATNQTSERESRPQQFGSRIQAHIKVLIKITRQKEKTSHHLELLTTAVSEEKPPRGLIPRITPRLPETSATFNLAWEEALHNTGLDLTKKLLDYWNLRLMKLLEEEKTIQDSLEQIASRDQCRDIEKILEEVARNTKMDLSRKRPQRSQSQTAITPARKQSLTAVTFSPRPGTSRDPTNQS